MPPMESSGNIDLRIGQGVDVHAFSGARGTLHLACLEWPDEELLEGHSDADVVAHAVCDSLLMAAGVGDLGSVFGVDDPRYRNAAGSTLLEATLDLVNQGGWQIRNVSVQLVGNRPRIGARRAEAEAAISRALAGASISLGATTTDHLGFLGRGEGLAALATALLGRL